MKFIITLTIVGHNFSYSKWLRRRCSIWNNDYGRVQCKCCLTCIVVVFCVIVVSYVFVAPYVYLLHYVCIVYCCCSEVDWGGKVDSVIEVLVKQFCLANKKGI